MAAVDQLMAKMTTEEKDKYVWKQARRNNRRRLLNDCKSLLTK
jgi:hypothetical protein